MLQKTMWQAEQPQRVAHRPVERDDLRLLSWQAGEQQQALVALESGAGDEEALGAIFRVAHTVKGNASTFGLQSVAELAHGLEDVLARLRSRELPVTSAFEAEGLKVGFEISQEELPKTSTRKVKRFMFASAK